VIPGEILAPAHDQILPAPDRAPMDLRSSKVIGMLRKPRSACRNRWSASSEYVANSDSDPTEDIGGE